MFVVQEVARILTHLPARPNQTRPPLRLVEALEIGATAVDLTRKCPQGLKLSTEPVGRPGLNLIATERVLRKRSLLGVVEE